MPYDTITQGINQFNEPVLTVLASLIHDNIIFLVLLVGLLLLGERGERTKKILVALVFVALLSLGLKEAFQIERPCNELITKVPCPESYSFPSIHATLAFTLAIAFLYRSNYWIYIAFALLVAASRIYLGVHTFEDVAASLALAAVSYSFIDRIWVHFNEKKRV